MVVVAQLDVSGGQVGRWMDGPGSTMKTRGMPSYHDEPPSFDAVYTEYFAHVSRWMRAFGAPAADVDDLAQEVFLVVQRKLPSFDGRNLGGWLYRITQRTVSDFRRRSWFKRFYQRSDADPGAIVCDRHGPQESLERRDAAAILERTLVQMSRIRRTAFVLFEVEGYTAQEIAELEGIPVNTVHTRLHHARHDFLRLLSKETGEPLGELP